MFTFDGPTTTIFLTLGTTELDVKDLYSRWKEWVQMGDNSKWPIAFRAIGGDQIDATTGTFVPTYAYLQNGWHIHPQQANHTLNVTGGILLVEGGGDPFEDVAGFTVRVNYQQPVQAITVGSSFSATDATKIDEMHKLHGLDSGNPLVVTATTRDAGAGVSQTISENAGTVTVTRQ